jgi:hypothetical protein
VIRRLLDAGLPVIMEESYSSSNHVAVAIGYDDAREVLEVQDPMTHSIRETFYEDLAGLRNLSNHGALIGAPRSDPALVRKVDEVSGGEAATSRWSTKPAAQDDGRAEDGDRLVDQAVELHRATSWPDVPLNRARDGVNQQPGPTAGCARSGCWPRSPRCGLTTRWPQQLLGQALYFDDRAGEALVAFERARDRDPNDAYNWSMIADCHLEMATPTPYDARRGARPRSLVRPR